MAVTRDLAPIIKAMKKDKKFKRLKEAFETLPVYQIPVEKWADEIENIHKTRLIRILDSENPKFHDEIVRANIHDQSARGRLTAIMMRCVRATVKLEKALKTLRYHLLLSYSDELRGYRTKEERQQVVELALQPFEHFINDASMLRESATLCVKDIDQGNFSLDKTLRVLEMHTQRERNI